MRYQIYEAKSVKYDAQQRVGIMRFLTQIVLNDPEKFEASYTECMMLYVINAENKMKMVWRRGTIPAAFFLLTLTGSQELSKISDTNRTQEAKL